MKKKGPSFHIWYWLSYPIFFWFDLFLEARAEILTKISLFFGLFEDAKNISKLTYHYESFLYPIVYLIWTLTYRQVWTSLDQFEQI